MNAETIAKGLQKARKSGNGYVACCVAHNDHEPSLSLTDGNHGKVLVHCHAGCPQQAVIDALKSKGLWPQPERRQDHIVATYSYTDEVGTLLYQIIRLEPKRFQQRYPDAYGGWIWKKHPRQVLYRLPAVLEAPIVFLVEGEKDVETLLTHGFIATTNAGGAVAPWLDSFSETLRGREVIIIPDNDGPGWTRAKAIAGALLGHAERIRVLDLPRETKDISDWFAAGHRECELIAMLEGVHAV